MSEYTSYKKVYLKLNKRYMSKKVHSICCRLYVSYVKRDKLPYLATILPVVFVFVEKQMRPSIKNLM